MSALPASRTSSVSDGRESLHVCLINDSFPPAIDGVSNAVTNYARIISRDYGEATVVTPYYPKADDSVYPFPVIRYPSVDVTRLVGYRAGLPFSPEIAARLEKSQFDVIHSHCPITSTMLARSVRERLDVPLVFTYHTKFDIDIANAIRSKILQGEAARILAENISACDEVWTVSNGAGENLRKLGYQGDYLVMPNGVDFPTGRVPDELVRAETEGFNLPEGVPVFLFVGRMMWYKGIRISLDALKKLADGGMDFRMVFVGGGADKREIVTYAKALGLGRKVAFADPILDRDRIRAWYCRADLFLFPSTFDTNGLV
ncbi:MAG: glycosyltransferase, partial [Oscillospiraceae bacterium]|nr:glycosyltransferase [Oscillospiraceae bacterium]